MLPLKDRVVMRQLKAKEKTKSGIILTETTQKKPNLAIVEYIGPEVASVAIGDMVVLGDKWFTNFTLKGQDLLILNEPDLVGKLTDSERVDIEQEYGA